jgi:hypothetical protein
MASLDNAAGNVQKFLSIIMGCALLCAAGFGFFVKMPAWYADRKAEAARGGGPGLNLNRMRGGGPATYLASETKVEYTPNAKIIRTRTWQVNEPAKRR